MLPKKKQKSGDLFRSRLEHILDLDHSLCKLAREIDWSAFESELGDLYSETMGRPSKTLRLMIGIHYLKHAFDESDESVIERWLENPYWQYFCGCEYFQHTFPCDSSLLPKWRKRISNENMATLLVRLLDVAKNRGNPYDGHTLKEALVVMEHMTGMTANYVHVDKGYRGHGYSGTSEIHLPGKRRGKRKQTRSTAEVARPPVGGGACDRAHEE